MRIVALSTMWAKDRFVHMAGFASRARELGFTHIEANHWISAQMLAELIETLVPVSSIHSPCPAASSSAGIPVSKLSLSSLDESERMEAVTFAGRTIDLASDLRARAVVLHMGEVPVDLSLEDRLRRSYSRGLGHDAGQKRIREELVRQRTSRAPRYLDAARKSLQELAEYGQSKGIMLGIETRFHYHEIPGMDEAAELLEAVPEGAAGYWHDVGHAEVQERLGFSTHAEWFSRFKHRMIGIHLHDVLGIVDHHVPGKGDMNWEMIARDLPAGAVRVCEIGEWNDEQRLEGVVDFLKRAGLVS
ncbi:MAG: TIM barrel protein [Dehalococcoidia bacterium]|nr:TIM barrel protein [Dehalococcoidia bacterium]